MYSARVSLSVTSIYHLPLREGFTSAPYHKFLGQENFASQLCRHVTTAVVGIAAGIVSGTVVLGTLTETHQHEEVAGREVLLGEENGTEVVGPQVRNNSLLHVLHSTTYPIPPRPS